MKKLLFLLTIFTFLIFSPVYAEEETGTNPDTDSDVLILDTAQALCRRIQTRSSNDYACDSVKDGDTITLNGHGFVPSTSQKTIIKNVKLKITGFNARFSIVGPGVTIENSEISNTHGCLFLLTEENAKKLKIVSGTFTTETTTDNQAYTPSPFCVVTGEVEDGLAKDTSEISQNEPNLGLTNQILQSVLAPGSTFYAEETSQTILQDLASGTNPRGKLPDASVIYLNSTKIAVKNIPETPEDPEDPEAPGISEDSTPESEQPVIPKAPNTGVR